MLYLYALTGHPAEVDELAGIDETAVTVEAGEAIDAVVGTLERERVEPSEAAVLAHARVVEAVAAANEAVLPARFGRGYSDTSALRAAIGERTGELEQALARVRGCVELGVRALTPRAEAPRRDGTGADYMRARLEERRRAERLADALHTPLAALSRSSTQSVEATPGLLLSAAYLVPRDAVEGFRSTVAGLGDEHPELTLACTGPWPPYSFATTEVATR